VTFTLSTHSAGGVTQLDVELAHQILQSAASVGALTLPPAERVEIALDVADAERVRPFWAAALGYREQADPAETEVELTPRDGRGPVLWFQSTAADDPRLRVRSRFHLDVHVPRDQVQARLAACLDAGGRLVSDAHAPSWWVLADPEGNEVCLCI
jgi:4a-hydroxytetrahydrobiopterin dehydratase